MLAYQTGKAAKVAPAATISQTSLPSQTGPMAFRQSRRSSSSRPMTRLSMPTPKSKPSSTKYPVHSTPIRANHAVFRLATGPFTALSSVDEFLGRWLTRDARLPIRTLFVIRAQPALGGEEHENHVDDSEHGVEQDETAQGEGHVGGRDTG